MDGNPRSGSWGRWRARGIRAAACRWLQDARREAGMPPAEVLELQGMSAWEISQMAHEVESKAKKQSSERQPRGFEA